MFCHGTSQTTGNLKGLSAEVAISSIFKQNNYRKSIGGNFTTGKEIPFFEKSARTGDATARTEREGCNNKAIRGGVRKKLVVWTKRNGFSKEAPQVKLIRD